MTDNTLICSTCAEASRKWAANKVREFRELLHDSIMRGIGYNRSQIDTARLIANAADQIALAAKMLAIEIERGE